MANVQNSVQTQPRQMTDEQWEMVKKRIASQGQLPAITESVQQPNLAFNPSSEVGQSLLDALEAIHASKTKDNPKGEALVKKPEPKSPPKVLPKNLKLSQDPVKKPEPPKAPAVAPKPAEDIPAELFSPAHEYGPDAVPPAAIKPPAGSLSLSAMSEPSRDVLPLPEAPSAPSKGDSMSDEQKMAAIALAIIPALAGGLIGGREGFYAGGAAGGKGLEVMGKAAHEKELKKASAKGGATGHYQQWDYQDPKSGKIQSGTFNTGTGEYALSGTGLAKAYKTQVQKDPDGNLYILSPDNEMVPIYPAGKKPPEGWVDKEGQGAMPLNLAPKEWMSFSGRHPGESPEAAKVRHAHYEKVFTSDMSDKEKDKQWEREQQKLETQYQQGLGKIHAQGQESRATKSTPSAPPKKPESKDMTFEQKLAGLKGQEKQNLAHIISGIDAVNGMKDALRKGDWTIHPIGDNQFTLNRKYWNEAIGRLSSGGAIQKEEASSFKSLVPGGTDTAPTQQSKLDEALSRMYLRAKIYGFSPEEIESHRDELHGGVAPSWSSGGSPSSVPSLKDVDLNSLSDEQLKALAKAHGVK